MKALIFPNDPLIEYVKKGEIKENYFNPNNVFDEIHFITFTAHECSVEDIQVTIGKAKGYIHAFKPFTLWDYIFPYKRVSLIILKIEDLKFDLVRSYAPFLAGYIAAMVAKKTKTNSTVSIHSDFKSLRCYFIDIRSSLRAIKYWLLYLYEFKCYKLYDQIIGVSKKSLSTVPNKFKKKTIVKHNTINTNYFFHIPDLEKKYDIIMVGRLEKPKRQDLLLEAITEIPQKIKILFIGNGIEKGKLEKYAKKHQISLTIIESIPNNELVKFYNQSRINVQLSDYEGFGIPIIEAAACGIPSVCSDIQVFHELSRLTIIYKKNKAHDIKTGIEKIL